MLNALHTGLIYGLIAGTSIIVFSLTLLSLWGLIEIITRISDFRDAYFNRGGEHEDNGGNG